MPARRLFIVAGLWFFATALPAQEQPIRATAAPAERYRVYIGTYTAKGKSQGIYRLELDTATGQLSTPVLAAPTVSPSFLAIHPNEKFLYSVGEISNYEGKREGGVSAFAIDPATGDLKLLNQQGSGGAGPCHLRVDASGSDVLVANYGGGSCGVLPIEADGRLRPMSSRVQHTGSSVNPRRQKEPHAHSINLAPDNKFAFVADLGLDKVLVYRFDATHGQLTPNEPPAANVAPGAGPRHFAFHPNGRWAYVINELALTLTAFRYNAAAGTLTEEQTISTVPEGVQGEKFSTAEVVVHPSGRFVYGSNRGHNSIAVFSVDPSNGRLSLVEIRGEGINTPRNFNVDPTGRWLLVANQGGDSVIVFAIDAQTGKLTPTGTRVEVGAPCCVKFLAIR